MPHGKGIKVTRRHFACTAAHALALSLAGSGCEALSTDPLRKDPRLTSRPATAKTTAPPGLRELGLRRWRDAVIRVPASADGRGLPLIVLFHGAGGSGSEFLRYLTAALETVDAVILAPDSEGTTWDAVTVVQRDFFDVLLSSEARFEGFGPDVRFLDTVLEHVFATVAIDPLRVSVAGFSDGATYALSLGLANGDLFRRIVAFSPGFVFDSARRGKPEIFISHGRQDRVLPIERTARHVASNLRREQYQVTYSEFEGGHVAPESIARDALNWAVE